MGNLPLIPPGLDSTERVKWELERGKQATERNKIPPVPRPHQNRGQLLALFNDLLEPEEPIPLESITLRTVTTIITGESPCCLKGLDELRPITLREMQVPMVHRGSLLVCRVITKALVRAATAEIVEDLEGEVEELSLYNFRPSLSDRTWLPESTIMIIKEPFLKYGSIGHNVTMRVDSPSDVVFVDETDRDLLASVGALKWHKKERLSAEQLRVEGNVRYVKKDYEAALKFYDRALLIDPTSAVVLLNKSAALIGLDRNYEAHQAAAAALDNGADRAKALYRLGKSAYRMRCWDKAVHYFRSLQEEFPKNECAKEELPKSMDRLIEAKNGKYDFDRLYQEAFQEGKRRLDVADYVGPIEVTDIPGKGKGFVASTNIAKGTLLLVSKAFACTYPDECDSLVFAPNMLTKRGDMTTAFYNKMHVIQMLQRSPHRAKELYSLYARDLPREHSIPDDIIDAARIEQICSVNSFALRELKVEKSQAEMQRLSGPEETPSALFTTPSFFNHSCLPNAYRAFYGDVIVVHAIDDLKKGEEVSITYIDAQQSYKERAKRLSSFGFECQCELCILDRSDELYEHREKLIEQLAFLKPLLDADPRKLLVQLNPLVEQLRQTFHQRKTLRLQLLKPLMMLSAAYRQLNEFDASNTAAFELLACLDDSLLYRFGAEFYRAIVLNMMALGRGREFEKYKRLIGQYVKLRAGITDRLVDGLILTDGTFP